LGHVPPAQQSQHHFTGFFGTIIRPGCDAAATMSFYYMDFAAGCARMVAN